MLLIEKNEYLLAPLWGRPEGGGGERSGANGRSTAQPVCGSQLDGTFFSVTFCDARFSAALQIAFTKFGKNIGFSSPSKIAAGRDPLVTMLASARPVRSPRASSRPPSLRRREIEVVTALRSRAILVVPKGTSQAFFNPRSAPAGWIGAPFSVRSRARAFTTTGEYET